MIITPQSLRGIYIGFNTIFNKALEEAKPQIGRASCRERV